MASTFCCLAGCADDPGGGPAPQTSGLTMMFYNVENLFDTTDDPANPGDDEFLPESNKLWTAGRYQLKLQGIARVISEIGGTQGLPALVGLAEVENKAVLDDLLSLTSLPEERYAVLHRDSPDERGIDVAILYDQFALRLIEWDAIAAMPGFAPNFRTRDILHAVFELNGELLHVFANHWTSRLGGTAASEQWRIAEAEILRREINLIFDGNPDAAIVVCGDFNDEPSNRSVIDVLNAGGNCHSLEEGELCNPFYNLAQSGEGSYKYGGWQMIDQMMVSQTLLDERNAGIYAPPGDAGVFMPDWLMEYHPSYGYQPKRTYSNDNYAGGTSDHLPVYLRIHLSIE